MKKIKQTIEVEYVVDICQKCGKGIMGRNESQFKTNMQHHQLSKNCKEKKNESGN